VLRGFVHVIFQWEQVEFQQSVFWIHCCDHPVVYIIVVQIATLFLAEFVFVLNLLGVACERGPTSHLVETFLSFAVDAR
jgi:hypothetical protein